MRNLVTIVSLFLSIQGFSQLHYELTNENIENCSKYGSEFHKLTWFELEDGSSVLNLGDTITPQEGNYTLELAAFQYWTGTFYKKMGVQIRTDKGSITDNRRPQLLKNDSDDSMVLLNEPWFLGCVHKYEETMASLKELNAVSTKIKPAIDTIRLKEIVQLVLKDKDIIATGAAAWQGGRLTGDELTKWTNSTKHGLSLIKEGFLILNGQNIVDYMHWKKAEEYLEAVEVVRGSAILLSLDVD